MWIGLIIPAISDLKPKQWYDNKPLIKTWLHCWESFTITILKNEASTNELYSYMWFLYSKSTHI